MKEAIAKNLVHYRNIKAPRMSQERLAELVGVSRQSINNYEKARTLPDSKVLAQLANVLGVTLDDLLRSPVDEAQIDENALNFLFRANASFVNKPQFTASIRHLLETYSNLESIVGCLPYTPEMIPCYRKDGNEKHIEDVAMQFRHRIGVGEDKPIRNLFQSVEDLGLKVLRKDIPIAGFFGLSAYSIEHGAFVLVNTYNVTVERQIFTLAHEIGHLIFHRGEYHTSLVDAGVDADGNSDDDRERVADYFAGHLLVPAEEFDRLHQLIGDDYADIIKLKYHFRVSYAVILRRLNDLGKIDYGKKIAQIRALYKAKYSESLKQSMELTPSLDSQEFPKNERFKKLVSQALDLGAINKETAGEYLEYCRSEH